jgi:hypothetical protein
VDEQLSPYQHSQLTSLAECVIHTHARLPLNQQAGTELQEAHPVKTVANNYVLTMFDDMVMIDPAAGSVDVYLPPSRRSKEYWITSIGTGTLTVHGNGSDTINGAATIATSTQWTTFHLKATNQGSWIRL